MALGKYFEDNLEIYEERMAMRDYAYAGVKIRPMPSGSVKSREQPKKEYPQDLYGRYFRRL